MNAKNKGMVLALCTTLMLGSVNVQNVSAANEISRLVPFQGRLHASDSKVVPDGVYDLTFNIYETPTGGTPVWTESHAKVSVIHGYVNVLLGAVNPMDNANYPLATTKPAYDPAKSKVHFTKKKYLGISIDGGVEMFPRSQLVPSFHAYTANHADHATTSDHALQANKAVNADKLGNIAASSYAKMVDVTRLTNGVSDRTDALETELENKFTGDKANNADELDGIDSINFMRTQNAHGHRGMMSGSNTNGWIRTTSPGILPFQMGGASSLGTREWPFNNIWANNIYDNGLLLENKYLGKSAKAASAITSDKLNGQSASYYRNATSINAGTLNSGRLPAIPASKLPNASEDAKGALKKNKLVRGVHCGASANCGYYWDKNTGFITLWGMYDRLTNAPRTVQYPIEIGVTFNVMTNLSQNGNWKQGGTAYTYNYSKTGFTIELNGDSGTSHTFWRAIGYKAP